MPVLRLDCDNGSLRPQGRSPYQLPPGASPRALARTGTRGLEVEGADLPNEVSALSRAPWVCFPLLHSGGLPSLP